jgi:hypothetical protein
MHGIMEKPLGSLYPCPRGLLRRRQWKLGVMISNFLWENSPNFWVSPCVCVCVCVYMHDMGNFRTLDATKYGEYR